VEQRASGSTYEQVLEREGRESIWMIGELKTPKWVLVKDMRGSGRRSLRQILVTAVPSDQESVNARFHDGRGLRIRL
jgi:hypothetical protein